MIIDAISLYFFNQKKHLRTNQPTNQTVTLSPPGPQLQAWQSSPGPALPLLPPELGFTNRNISSAGLETGTVGHRDAF